MFERTKIFWRRLVGHGTETGNIGLEDGSDDRRIWDRFPADLETTVKPAGKPDSTRFVAQVRNISLGGINLLGNRHFEAGELLTIQLPGNEDDRCCTVLACVAHCVKEPDGQWSLGCDFSRELSEEDLAFFGAKRERHDQDDQRLWKRFPCNVTAAFQLVAADDQTVCPAKVIDISASGVGLLVERMVETGSLLSVELHNSASTTARTMLACVVHVNRQAEDGWALGCNFIRSLGEEDLKALV